MENYQATMNKKYSFTSRKPVQSTFMDPHMLMVKRGTGVDGSARWLTEDPTSLTDRYVQFHSNHQQFLKYHCNNLKFLSFKDFYRNRFSDKSFTQTQNCL